MRKGPLYLSLERRAVRTAKSVFLRQRLLERLGDQCGATDMPFLGELCHTLEQPLFQTYRDAFESLARLGPAPLSTDLLPLLSLCRRQGARLINDERFVELL